ncbi:MAG: phosphoribosylanthranilate isomerase [Anaerolineae bacterium]
MVKVKICGLTNLDDARHAANSGADLLGFIFVPASPRYISANLAYSIIAGIRDEGYEGGLVGVFVGENPEKVRDIASHCQLDYVQLHGHESPHYAHQLGIPVFVARRVTKSIPWDDLSAYHAKAYLLDSNQPGILGGSGVTWDWEALANAPRNVNIILAGGLNPANVAGAIATAVRYGITPWGVDVSSGVERSPGLKDCEQVRAFIRATRGAPA